jgi:TolA-binding protein
MKKLGLALAIVALASPAFAADKQHLQMMAEIRMLQEQQQQLQAVLGSLSDALKTLNTKLDDQASATRKAMADQTLAVNNIADNVRALREKTDETNVRVSQVSQNLDALRQAIASQPAPQATIQAQTPGTPGTPDNPAGATGGNPPSSTAPSQTASSVPPPGVSPQRMYETSYDDYTAGRFDLAISGFQNFLQYFSKLPNATDAEFNIGMSYYNKNDWNNARDAFLRVTTDFAAQAQGSVVSDAYYKLGQSYEKLNQVDAAKKAYETTVQKYPASSAAILAGNALQRLNRK